MANGMDARWFFGFQKFLCQTWQNVKWPNYFLADWWCWVMCAFKVFFARNTEGQNSHCNDTLAGCSINRCFRTWYWVANRAKHFPHTCVFKVMSSSACTKAMWVIFFRFVTNRCEQCSHGNGCNSTCFFCMCSFNAFCSAYPFPHDWHWNALSVNLYRKCTDRDSFISVSSCVSSWKCVSRRTNIAWYSCWYSKTVFTVCAVDLLLPAMIFFNCTPSNWTSSNPWKHKPSKAEMISSIVYSPLLVNVMYRLYSFDPFALSQW